MNNNRNSLFTILVVALATLLTGCPNVPQNAVSVSTTSLDFGRVDEQLTLEVWNNSSALETVTISVSSLDPWITVTPRTVTSVAPSNSGRTLDKKTIRVSIDKTQIPIGESGGRILFSASDLAPVDVRVTVTRDNDAIEFGKSALNFERSESPEFLEVWNGSTEVETMTVDVTPSDSWIIVNATSITSMAPDSGGALDRQSLTVSIDRSQLLMGNHAGAITFSALGIVTREVPVTVVQDQDGMPLGALNIVNPNEDYADPYLIDFSFTLRDENGNAVVEDPASFDIEAREGADPIASETGFHVQRGTARQLRVALVLDYTESMQNNVDGAIAAMEAAAKNTLLPALNEDALVSVTEFHRDDRAAMEVVPFTFDRDFLGERIDAIQSEFVGGFFSASAMLDAVLGAAESFPDDPENDDPGDDEDRYIIVFTDGDDTSSSIAESPNDVINAANARGIRIYAVNFGSDEIAADLQTLTLGTEGVQFSAATVSDLDESFRQIVRDLDGQYTLRWASLARSGNPITPGFTLALNGESATYTATEQFVPTEHAGNGVLEGKLRFVVSDNLTSTTVFLRADYVPRFIRRFSIYLKSDAGFTVTPVDGDNNGLFAGWELTETDDETNGGTTLDFVSPGDPIPFGTFGPMLRVTFDTLLGEGEKLFSAVYVDNEIYADTGEQSFVVQGYANTPPGE